MQKPPGLKLRRGYWHIDKVVRVGTRRVSIRQSTGLGEAELADAISLLEQTVADAKAGLIQPASPPEHTFREAAVQYVLHLERRGKDPERSKQDLRLLDPWIGELPLSHVHQGALEQFEAAQRGKRKSSTVGRAYRTITAVLNYAARSLRDGNRPWLTYAVPKISAPDWQDGRRPYRLTWREQDGLVEALPEHLRCPVRFALATGAREQEVVSLRWDHEVLAPGLPRGAVWWVPPEVRKGSARASASERDGRYLVANAEARRVVDANRGNGSEWVFLGPRRRRRAAQTRMERINNSAWRAAAGLAGLPVRIHDLRHTFGERLEAAGVPYEYRKALLGHRIADITAHYSAPGLRRLVEFAERVTRQDAVALRVVAQLPHQAKRKATAKVAQVLEN